MGSKILLAAATLILTSLMACARQQAWDQNADAANATDSVAAEASGPDSSIPEGAQAIIATYREAFDSVNPWVDNHLVMRDGTRLTYDDGRFKTSTERLGEPDIEDMMTIRYELPNVWKGKAPAFLSDPGRVRNEVLMKHLWGATAAEVQSHLVNVDWMGQKLKFSSLYGAADSLAAVAREMAQYPELAKWLKSSGTFNWRNVRGAERMSPHSWGIAIDIASDRSDFWQWRNRGASEDTRITYNNRIPREIVEIFQRHGFIWGGAWYHYDTMHFEFRPELLYNR